MKKIVECIPNFSTSDPQILKILKDCFEKYGVLIDYECDVDHNRSVITSAGNPKKVVKAIIEAVGVAVKHIDLNHHKGVHPRMGAADVIPFVPVKNMTMDEAVKISKKVGKTIAKRFGVPIFLYANSATAPNKVQLSDIRRGGFENMAQKMQDPQWQPDYGQNIPHKTAGVTACGARDFLVAYNINLNTSDVNIAKSIASKIRESNGGLRGVKALGLMLESINTAQVSMNITDCDAVSLYQVFSTVKKLAEEQGVSIKNSELIGYLPMHIISKSLKEAVLFDDFDENRVLEYKLWNK
ncbi:MAG TPA: glutamate formimidoyltransferase [Clostridia bacterium]